MFYSITSMAFQIRPPYLCSVTCRAELSLQRLRLRSVLVECLEDLLLNLHDGLHTGSLNKLNLSYSPH